MACNPVRPRRSSLDGSCNRASTAPRPPTSATFAGRVCSRRSAIGLSAHTSDDAHAHSIAKLEMLDEVEELDLVLSHYVLAWATRGELLDELTLPVQPVPPPLSATPSISSDSSMDAS